VIFLRAFVFYGLDFRLKHVLVEFERKSEVKRTISLRTNKSRQNDSGGTILVVRHVDMTIFQL